MGYLPKVATFDLVTQTCAGLVTACIPVGWTIAGGTEAFQGVGLACTIASIAATVLSVTSPFWMQLHPILVLLLIYLIAVCTVGSGLPLVALEVQELEVGAVAILGHIFQCGLATIIGQNLEKSPERTAPFDAFRWVHMLIGGALAVAGSIMAVFALEEFDLNKRGIQLGGGVAYAAFGVMLTFPLWHRHENPLVRGGVATIIGSFISLMPLLGFAGVVMFYPATMPGQILVCYAVGGYQGEAQRQLMITKALVQGDQQHDDPEQPAEQPLAASAEPIAGIAAG